MSVDLPPNWICLLSKTRNGKKYYYNTETGVSTWTLPKHDGSSDTDRDGTTTDGQKKKKRKRKKRTHSTDSSCSLPKKTQAPCDQTTAIKQEVLPQKSSQSSGTSAADSVSIDRNVSSSSEGNRTLDNKKPQSSTEGRSDVKGRVFAHAKRTLKVEPGKNVAHNVNHSSSKTENVIKTEPDFSSGGQRTSNVKSRESVVLIGNHPSRKTEPGFSSVSQRTSNAESRKSDACIRDHPSKKTEPRINSIGSSNIIDSEGDYVMDEETTSKCQFNGSSKSVTKVFQPEPCKEKTQKTSLNFNATQVDKNCDNIVSETVGADTKHKERTKLKAKRKMPASNDSDVNKSTSVREPESQRLPPDSCNKVHPSVNASHKGQTKNIPSLFSIKTTPSASSLMQDHPQRSNTQGFKNLQKQQQQSSGSVLRSQGQIQTRSIKSESTSQEIHKNSNSSHSISKPSGSQGTLFANCPVITKLRETVRASSAPDKQAEGVKSNKCGETSKQNSFKNVKTESIQFQGMKNSGTTIPNQGLIRSAEKEGKLAMNNNVRLKDTEKFETKMVSIDFAPKDFSFNQLFQELEDSASEKESLKTKHIPFTVTKSDNPQAPMGTNRTIVTAPKPSSTSGVSTRPDSFRPSPAFSTPDKFQSFSTSSGELTINSDSSINSPHVFQGSTQPVNFSFTRAIQELEDNTSQNKSSKTKHTPFTVTKSDNSQTRVETNRALATAPKPSSTSGVSTLPDSVRPSPAFSTPDKFQSFSTSSGELTINSDRSINSPHVFQDADLDLYTSIDLGSSVADAAPVIEDMEIEFVTDGPDAIVYTLMLVIDTNVFIDSLAYLSRLINSSVPGYGKPTLVLPWVVIQELDNLKVRKSNNSLAHKAIRAVRFIHTHLMAKNPHVKGQTPQEANEKSDLPIEKNDDKILHCCLQYQKKFPSSQLFLVTHDINLTNKATIMGIDATDGKDLWAHLESSCEFRKADNVNTINPKTETVNDNMIPNESPCVPMYAEPREPTSPIPNEIEEDIQSKAEKNLKMAEDIKNVLKGMSNNNSSSSKKSESETMPQQQEP
ncbi:hypothetical protein EGW08_005141, partial [Elysia chlorotica]